MLNKAYTFATQDALENIEAQRIMMLDEGYTPEEIAEIEYDSKKSASRVFKKKQILIATEDLEKKMEKE